MSRTRLVALVVTAVCLSFSAGDAGIVPTERRNVKKPDGKIKSNCLPNRLRKDRGDPISCCQDGDRMYLTLDGHKMAFRTLGGKPCTEADGKGANCEGQQDDPQTCAYGPCGAKKEFIVTAEKVHIFKPHVEHHGKPKKCGWTVNQFIECKLGDCKDWTKGSDHSDPETFDEHKHKEYGGVKPSCRFTGGCAKGGHPIP